MILTSSQTDIVQVPLSEFYAASDIIKRKPLLSFVMAIFSRISSFRTATYPRSFIIHIGEEEYVTIDESVLCTIF